MKPTEGNTKGKMKLAFEQLWPSLFLVSQEMEGIKTKKIEQIPKVVLKRLTEEQILRLGGGPETKKKFNLKNKRGRCLVIASDDDTDNDDPSTLQNLAPSVYDSDSSDSSNILSEKSILNLVNSLDDEKRDDISDKVDREVLQRVSCLKKDGVLLQSSDSVSSLIEDPASDPLNKKNDRKFEKEFDLIHQKIKTNLDANQATTTSNKKRRLSRSRSNSPTYNGISLKNSAPLNSDKSLGLSPPFLEHQDQQVARRDTHFSSNLPNMVSLSTETLAQYVNNMSKETSTQTEQTEYKSSNIITNSQMLNQQVDDVLKVEKVKLDQSALSMTSVEHLFVLGTTLNNCQKRLKEHRWQVEEEQEEAVKRLKREYNEKFEKIDKCIELYSKMEKELMQEKSNMYNGKPLSQNFKLHICTLLTLVDAATTKSDVTVQNKGDCPQPPNSEIIQNDQNVDSFRKAEHSKNSPQPIVAFTTNTNPIVTTTTTIDTTITTNVTTQNELASVIPAFELSSAPVSEPLNVLKPGKPNSHLSDIFLSKNDSPKTPPVSLMQCVSMSVLKYTNSNSESSYVLTPSKSPITTNIGLNNVTSNNSITRTNFPSKANDTDGHLSESSHAKMQKEHKPLSQERVSCTSSPSLNIPSKQVLKRVVKMPTDIMSSQSSATKSQENKQAPPMLPSMSELYPNAGPQKKNATPIIRPIPEANLNYFGQTNKKSTTPTFSKESSQITITMSKSSTNFPTKSSNAQNLREVRTNIQRKYDTINTPQNVQVNFSAASAGETTVGKTITPPPNAVVSGSYPIITQATRTHPSAGKGNSILKPSISLINASNKSSTIRQPQQESNKLLKKLLPKEKSSNMESQHQPLIRSLLQPCTQASPQNLAGADAHQNQMLSQGLNISQAGVHRQLPQMVAKIPSGTVYATGFNPTTQPKHSTVLQNSQFIITSQPQGAYEPARPLDSLSSNSSHTFHTKLPTYHESISERQQISEFQHVFQPGSHSSAQPLVFNQPFQTASHPAIRMEGPQNERASQIQQSSFLRNSLIAPRQEPQYAERADSPAPNMPFVIESSVVSLARLNQADSPNPEPEIMDGSAQACFICGVAPATVLCCGQFYYCGKPCKEMDWPRHQDECKARL